MKRKNKKQIETKIFSILKERELSVKQLSKACDSNWGTVKKYLDNLIKMNIVEPVYKETIIGYKIRKLDDEEKEILNILISNDVKNIELDKLK